ncbi:MAG: hypothetical protein C4563_00910 [Desulfobulbus sp.]|nr:MAG: hypothetical protein C4563_00910 [Desulfobulbus sp.]
MGKSEELKIAVCGDDAPACRETRSHAEKLGHCVVFEQAGAEDFVVESVAAARPDLVFVGCVHPEEEGLHLVRRFQDCQPLPLILLVGRVTPSLLREADDAGAAWVVPVPTDSAVLAEAVNIALLRHRDRRELRDMRERMARMRREFLHRVKNDLAVITALMHFQAGSCGNSGTERAILEGADRVRVISALYDVIRTSEDGDTLRLDHYLELLLSKVSQGTAAARGIEIAVSADCIILDGARALSCGLIVHEMVANALQHAFPGDQREKLIKVDIHKHPGDEHIEIRVADNGTGLPPDIDPTGATTFGLQLVSFLAGQLKGALTVDRSNGTAMTLSFKVPSAMTTHR